jgi:hypothetical protein
MHAVLKSLVAVIAGIAAGLALTWASVFLAHFGTVRNGPWATSLAVGSAQSGPYLRAYVAVHGLLALNRGETIYYNASRDSGGERLRGNCDYIVWGRDPAARWWSITAYGQDDFLIPNRAHRYSVSKYSVARGANDKFVIFISRDENSVSWIPVYDKPFSLTLRLYNPAASVAADPAHALLPAIIKRGCR